MYLGYVYIIIRIQKCIIVFYAEISTSNGIYFKNNTYLCGVVRKKKSGGLLSCFAMRAVRPLLSVPSRGRRGWRIRSAMTGWGGLLCDGGR
jgi:hypothetical protein